jgi:hypothetical protein
MIVKCRPHSSPCHGDDNYNSLLHKFMIHHIVKSWIYVIVAFELVNLIVKNTGYFSKHLAIFHPLKNENFNFV